MDNIIDRAVLDLFTGKARDKASAALDILDQSVAQGFWVPGASRSVRAALNKSAVAKKHSRRFDYSPEPFRLMMCLAYDPITYMDGALQTLELFKDLDDSDYDGSLGFARLYVKLLAPIVEMVRRLDATRPPPVFTTMKASPTVSKTVKDLGAVDIKVCPMKFEQVRRVSGKPCSVTFETVARLDWPDGTLHNTSRFTGSCQCQACGHAIRNRDNWVPLVLTSEDGTARSLWVGRDCAKTLFGIDVKGDLEIVGGRDG